MEDLYSKVNKSHGNNSIAHENTDQKQQHLQYAEIEISQAPTFPLVNDEAMTYEKRTRNNETFRVETLINNNANQADNKRKNSFEVYEHQQPKQQHYELPVQVVQGHQGTPIEIATENYTIKMQPSSNSNFNNNTNGGLWSEWNNLDTYLHIFLTFYFGHFASFLFFDGIVRNVESLIILNMKIFYVIYIIFSIVYLSFTLWTLTILWRWWRNKSLLPHDETQFVPNLPFLRKQQKLIARNYVFIATIIMAIGFFIYLLLAIIDNRYRYSMTALFFVDTTIITIRLILWAIAIIALLALNRGYFAKNVLPKHFYNDHKNEQQTIVYEIRQ